MASLHPVFQKLSEEARKRTLVMGVLNATPDSFSDGGKFLDPDKALARAREMLSQGADLLDLGGESTRPGAQPVDTDEELRRVLPVAERLAKKLPQAAWSIDTVKAKVAAAALDLGACMVNDVSALRQDPAMAGLVAARGCGAVLMHRAGAPKDSKWSTEESASYGEAGVVAFLRKFLTARVSDLMLSGVDKKQCWIDPGFGFGKSVEDNLAILKGLPELVASGFPVMLGTSRKSSLGAVLGGLPEEDRLEGTAASVAIAVWQGAACVRVHDVREMARIVKFTQAVKQAGPKPKEEVRPLHPFKTDEWS